MKFNSIEFLILFTLSFFIYWFVFNKSTKHQNIFLLIASYFFYGWWDWRFLSLIIINSLVDYYIGLKLSGTNDHKDRKVLLFVSLFVNLGILCFFKYFNFFADNFALLINNFGFKTNAITLNIVLPLGISFYTFKTLSYTIDIYRNQLEPTKNLISYLTYVAFFPQLIAGPIDRAKNLLPQFNSPRVFNYDYASSGAKLILLGFFKKMVIADNVSNLVDTVYNSPSNYTGFPMVVATIFFTIQIYCDFSGYSDIAIGTARILGFNSGINFNKPYFASSISDFWKRWHISLSTWFRDYLFLPVAYALSRKFDKDRYCQVKTDIIIYAYATIMTFLMCGLWHGASWTFIIWGAIHGLVIIIERAYKEYKKVFHILRSIKYPAILNIPITFIIVCFGWIFFRANSLKDVVFFLNNMFSDIGDYTSILKLSLKFRGMGLKIEDIITSIFFVGFLLFIEILDEHKGLDNIFRRMPIVKWCFYYLVIIFIVFWGTGNTANNFIYFQF